MATKTTKKTTAKKQVKPKKSIAKLKADKKSVSTKPQRGVSAEKKAAKTKATHAQSAPDTAVPSEEKKVVIAQFQVKEGDTGSPEVQVALLTKRIEKLVGHLKGNPADNHSRRGLLGIVSKRRRLLNYLEKKDIKRFKAIGQKLGLSK